jgi:WD40 repeat protein
VRVLRGPEAEVLDLALSPDGTAIAAGFQQYPVFLWNLESPTPAPVRLPAEGGYFPGGLHFSDDGRLLWWRRSDGYRIYNRDTRDYQSLSFGIGGVTHGAFASRDGKSVVSRHGMPDHCLIGWERAQGGWKRSWRCSTAELFVESMTLSDDGSLFALIAHSSVGARPHDNPRQVEVWNAATGGFEGKGEYPYAYAASLHFEPDSRLLVGFNDMTLLVWPVPELGVPRLVRNDSRKDFTAVAFHPDGSRLYAASNDGTVQLFDATSWQRIERYTWPLGRPKAVAVSSDGTLAAAGGDTGSIVIWDVDG